MKQSKLALYAAMMSGMFLLSGASAAQEAPQTVAAIPAQYKVVFQVSDADPRKWGAVLNNIHNVQEELGKNNVAVELVAYGPGIGMLKFDSEMGGRIVDAAATGVKVVACENTMKGQHLSRSDMNPSVGYVHAGVVEIMKLQQEGYAYIKP